jgi:hypothetical protein
MSGHDGTPWSTWAKVELLSEILLYFVVVNAMEKVGGKIGLIRSGGNNSE